VRFFLVGVAVAFAIAALGIFVIGGGNEGDAPSEFTFEQALADGHITKAEWVIAVRPPSHDFIAFVCHLSGSQVKALGDLRAISPADLEPVCR
jgi:hypothetical protein